MRVLLVEDEERLAAVVKEGLCDHDVAVDVEHDGELGLWRAREGSYDVIVLDRLLPDLEGVEVLRLLRARGVDTPVLMLTALDTTDKDEAADKARCGVVGVRRAAGDRCSSTWS